jgi:hypothetical protein
MVRLFFLKCIMVAKANTASTPDVDFGSFLRHSIMLMAPKYC